MAEQRRPQNTQRAKGKTPAERSEEFHAHQTKLKAEAAERREAREAQAREKS